MAENGNGNGNGDRLALRWGSREVSARGLTSILVLGLLLGLSIIAGSNVYSARLIIEAIKDQSHDLTADHDWLRGQHDIFANRQDRLACVVALSPEERSRFRADGAPGVWERWCAWMRSDNEMPRR